MDEKCNYTPFALFRTPKIIDFILNFTRNKAILSFHVDNRFIKNNDIIQHWLKKYIKHLYLGLTSLIVHPPELIASLSSSASLYLTQASLICWLVLANT